jgi:hypothetical protein
MKTQVELFGTHGTTKAKTRKISKEGFCPGARSGKAGTGVYFWAYEKSPMVAVDLAHNWWSWASNNGLYRNDTDKRCSIILASLKPNEGETGFFDCGDTSFQEELYSIAEVQGVTDYRDVASLYDVVLSGLEHELGKEFEVVKLHLPVPRPQKPDSGKQKLLNLLYSSYCSYIVRKNYREVIKIIEVR